MGSESGVLDVSDFENILPLHLARSQDVEGDESDALGAVMDQTEYVALAAALKKGNGNKAAAARFLGISRTNLYAKLNKHGLS